MTITQDRLYVSRKTFIEMFGYETMAYRFEIIIAKLTEIFSVFGKVKQIVNYINEPKGLEIVFYEDKSVENVFNYIAQIKLQKKFTRYIAYNKLRYNGFEFEICRYK